MLEQAAEMRRLGYSCGTLPRGRADREPRRRVPGEESTFKFTGTLTTASAPHLQLQEWHFGRGIEGKAGDGALGPEYQAVGRIHLPSRL